MNRIFRKAECLEGKRENYQLCSVQYCAPTTIVHSAMHTHMNRHNSSLDWVLSHWADFTVLRFIFVYVLLHACVEVLHADVGLVGLKPVLRTTTSFSALTLSVGSFDP